MAYFPEMAIRKVLIANRGEIAVRVARTCRTMGIKTVAVFSESDRTACHVLAADEAVPIGPSEAARSYLDIEAILGAARRTGADAVHPGYGFLSQSGDFAEAVEKAGLVFVGPPARVHRRMGDKSAARRLMAAAGVPVVPGYDGLAQDDATLKSEASRVGFPLLIKPSRGGGGKGMHAVARPEDFEVALRMARREAASSFGADAVVLERLVSRPRHVEVQVLAEGEGSVLHLGERECSIQRRHQKIVEEAPSPALDDSARARLAALGVAAARTAGYVNAGTVEFLLGGSGEAFFLEMNTRLQVEHAVTEAVTGLDIVGLQLRIAAGEPIGLTQEDVRVRGHSLECRLYAEDPENEDLPCPGRILHASFPSGPGVRVDAGVASGSEVTSYYDALLAKVITWGASRDEAIDRMRGALKDTVVLGIPHNGRRLTEIVEHPSFRSGNLHTGFLEENFSRPVAPPSPGLALAAALVALSKELPESPHRRSAARSDPWSSLGAWRLE